MPGMKVPTILVTIVLAWAAYQVFKSPSLGPGTPIEWWFSPETRQLVFAPGVTPPGPGFREPSEVEWETYGAGAPAAGGTL